MTEAWKSVPKKFCEICKCWIYDNKPSLQHHEQGRRHQESVKQKVREVGRKGREREHEERSKRIALAQMERAAVASYKRDMKEDPNRAAAYNIHLNLAALPIPAAPPIAKRQRYNNNEGNSAPSTSQDFIPIWYETVTTGEDGVTPISYYWNVETGETAWELPPEVAFVSIAEQEYAPSSSAPTVSKEGATINASCAWTSGYSVASTTHQAGTLDSPATQEIPVESSTIQETPTVEQSSNRAASGTEKSAMRKQQPIGKPKKGATGRSQIAMNVSAMKDAKTEDRVKRKMESSEETSSDEDNDADAQLEKPYGEWQPVQVEKSRKDEFSYLPHNRWIKEESDNVDAAVEDQRYAVDEEDMVKIKYGERTAPSQATAHSSVPCTFKKRKVGARSVRNRDD